jgi:hypothetical protein
VGEQAFVSQHLRTKYLEVEREILQVHDKLGAGHPQQRWLMLLKSSQFRIDYLLQHCKPDDTAELATLFDALMLRLADDVLGSSISAVPGGLARLHLPQRSNGLGIPSRLAMRDPAFTGAALKAIPALADRIPDTASGLVLRGIVSTDVVQELIGEGSFDDGNRDFSHFAASNSSFGKALSDSWKRMQLRIAPPGSLAPTSGALAADTSSMGSGITNIQSAAMTQLQTAAREELVPALPMSERAGIPFHASDSLSRQFLDCPPGACPMRPDVFRECFARYMGAPSPACAALVGRRIHVNMVGGRGGDGTVDKYGDNLITACTTGNQEAYFRHDQLVETLAAAARNAGAYAKAEDYTFYHPALPASALAALAASAGQSQRRVRLPVPDITLQLDRNKGLEIVEVKTVSYCQSWYRGGAQGAANRARPLHSSYLRDVRELDVELGLAQPVAGGPAGGRNATVGPLEARYLSVAPVRAVVVGGFGEGSADLHSLIQDIGQAAGARLQARLGLAATAASSLACRLLRREVGALAARGHAQLLLARLQFVAPIAVQRTARRALPGQVFSMRSLEGMMRGLRMGVRTGAAGASDA